MSQPKIKTLGELKKSGYKFLSIKDELRENLITKLKKNEEIFEGIFGYEETVIPELQRAILSRHNILFLGLRGQAKTKMARQLVNLLDEYIPVIAGSPLNDDPLQPISNFAKKLIAEKKDETPISWIHRADRFAEKLATPDVSVADLIGDLDPIKAANLKLSFSDENVIHYGLIPRSNRFIFVINELPDLQARLQVALFNILQEGDVQIRGFNLRIPLDLQFVFTANPEDYTNRGSIVTPLKDRIGSQILTHYPKSVEYSKQITQDQARLNKEQQKIEVPEILKNLVEQIAIEARTSEFVDSKSGVSARLTISAYESLISTAELRFLNNKQPYTFARISDLYGAIPAINGKIELVYEGEQEGPAVIAQNLISLAIRNLFIQLFPDPAKLKRKKEASEYTEIVEWFSQNNILDLLDKEKDEVYTSALNFVEGLEELVSKYYPKLKGAEKITLMEFVLHGLAEHSLLSKNKLVEGVSFKDYFGSLMNQNLNFDKEDNF
ncbi:magnesium chelatase [Aurantibacillus circumpalustris]|uniref:magnesium chelatase n=1 Tax=Aurantibacillus circumpalustris TaxID=3036359 RepID=UPI00295B8667|nr:magnesium chelatase [Aurantibacillus circumpalustris]